jgi:hypothetical protein
MGPDVFSPFSISRFKASAIVSSVTPFTDTFFFADDNLFKQDLRAKDNIKRLNPLSSFNNMIQDLALEHAVMIGCFHEHLAVTNS